MLILIAFLLFNETTPPQQPTLYTLDTLGSVKGKIVPAKGYLFKEPLNLSLFDSVEFAPVQMAISTKTHDFEFKNLNSKQRYNLKIESQNFGDTVIRNIDASQKNALDLSVIFKPNCPYAKTHKTTTCPKCKKSNQVVPIVYGKPGQELIKQYQAGKLVFGDCVMSNCMPFKYCKRCDRRF